MPGSAPHFVGTVTVVSLALAEGRTEAIAFAAVGAGPSLRRRLAAAQAAVTGPAVGLQAALARAWPYLATLALGPPLMRIPLKECE